MSRETYIDDIEFIARSHNRVYLLSLLHAHEQLDKSEIKDQCTAVRTTLQRNLDALEEHGWIQYTDTGEYRITPCGELIIEAFDYLLDTVETANHLDQFLRWVPINSFDLDPRTLADAEVTVSDPHNPYAVVNAHVDALKNTETFKGLLPIVGRDALEVRGRQHVNGEAVDELVVSTGAADVLRSDSSYVDTLQNILETGSLQVFVYDGQIPYFIGLYDDVIHIGVEDDEGIPRTLVETDAPEVREWAEQKYHNYREQSRPTDL